MDIYEKMHNGDLYDPMQEELKLLNTADMCIDSSGNHVGAVRRLADIEERYGVSSRQYTEAEKLAQRLGLI